MANLELEDATAVEILKLVPMGEEYFWLYVGNHYTFTVK